MTSQIGIEDLDRRLRLEIKIGNLDWQLGFGDYNWRLVMELEIGDLGLRIGRQHIINPVLFMVHLKFASSEFED